MTGDDFLLFMAHFIKQAMVTIYKPILLLLDSQSHLSVSVLKTCQGNGVVMLSISPYTTHKLESLNRSFMDLSRSSSHTLLTNHPGKLWKFKTTHP
jgi:hypothetical protein